MKSINSSVICSIPEIDMSLKTEIKSGFASIVQKKNAVGVTVLFDYEGESVKIPKGSTVFVKEEDLMVNVWAKTPVKLKGQEVLLIPISHIFAVDSQ